MPNVNNNSLFWLPVFIAGFLIAFTGISGMKKKQILIGLLLTLLSVVMIISGI